MWSNSIIKRINNGHTIILRLYIYMYISIYLKIFYQESGHITYRKYWQRQSEESCCTCDGMKNPVALSILPICNIEVPSILRYDIDAKIKKYITLSFIKICEKASFHVEGPT